MKAKAVLYKYDKHIDGSFAIKLYVNAHGKVRYYPLKLNIQEKDWNKEKCRVRRSHPFYREFNDKIELSLANARVHFANGGSHAEFKTGKSDKNSSSFISFVEDFTKEIYENKIPEIAAKSTGKSYKAYLRRLREYAQYHNLDDIMFDDITLDFYNSFKKYLYDITGIGDAGFDKHIRTTISIMTRALDRELHNNLAFRKKAFARVKVKSDKIFLTASEIQSIEELDLSDEVQLERERDRFLVQYYFLLRISDVRRIRKDMFFELEDQLYLRMSDQKEKNYKIVPVKPSALELLKKYDYNFDYTNDGHANKSIKTIVSLAGINNKVVQDGKTLPKSRFVTTHTARRSAATNLYLQSVPLKTIADLGGWKKIDTLMIYIRASGLDSANMASGLAFFK